MRLRVDLECAKLESVYHPHQQYQQEVSRPNDATTRSGAVEMECEKHGDWNQLDVFCVNGPIRANGNEAVPWSQAIWYDFVWEKYSQCGSFAAQMDFAVRVWL